MSKTVLGSHIELKPKEKTKILSEFEPPAYKCDARINALE